MGRIRLQFGDDILFIGDCTPFTYDPDLNTNDIDTLQARIEEACGEEDYERAAKIRDYITKLACV